jgi:hypothetical protein
MSTHGDLLIVDEGSDSGQWLHAFSDGHKSEIYSNLQLLPEFFFERILLDQQIPQKGLGKGWYLNQCDVDKFDKYWNHCLSVCSECYASTVSSLIVSRWMNRWCPIPEQDAPWHEVGENPDFKIVCRSDEFDIISYDDEFENITVQYLDRLFNLIKNHIK